MNPLSLISRNWFSHILQQSSLECTSFLKSRECSQDSLRLIPCRWDVPVSRFPQVPQPSLSDYIPRLGPMLGSWKPRSFVSTAKTITISPLCAGHLSVSKVLSCPVHPYKSLQQAGDAGARLSVSRMGGIRVQKGEVSNSLSFSFLFIQTFRGHLLGAGTVLGPQDTNTKTASITTVNADKAPATWQELLGTYHIQTY